MRSIVMHALLLVAALAGTLETAHGEQRRTLPEFTVSLADGSALASSRLGIDGPWLLLYVRNGCPQCDVLLSAANQPATGRSGRVVILVANASAGDLEALASRYPNLAVERWFGDASMAAFKQLGQAGVPFILGMRGTITEWTLSGVLADPPTIESVMRSWIAGGR